MDRPLIGVATLLARDGKVLVGRRRGSHGAGRWAFTGGHLEFGESWEECARRELLEEAGLRAGPLAFAAATNDIGEGKHYVTIYLIGPALPGEPEDKEPDRCEGWRWAPWDDLPRPLWSPLENLLAQGYDPRTRERCGACEGTGVYVDHHYRPSGCATCGGTGRRLFLLGVRCG